MNLNFKWLTEDFGFGKKIGIVQRTKSPVGYNTLKNQLEINGNLSVHNINNVLRLNLEGRNPLIIVEDHEDGHKARIDLICSSGVVRSDLPWFKVAEGMKITLKEEVDRAMSFIPLEYLKYLPSQFIGYEVSVDSVRIANVEEGKNKNEWHKQNFEDALKMQLNDYDVRLAIEAGYHDRAILEITVRKEPTLIKHRSHEEYWKRNILPKTTPLQEWELHDSILNYSISLRQLMNDAPQTLRLPLDEQLFKETLSSLDNLMESLVAPSLKNVIYRVRQADKEIISNKEEYNITEDNTVWCSNIDFWALRLEKYRHRLLEANWYGTQEGTHTLKCPNMKFLVQ
jgi:hypothetical protein